MVMSKEALAKMDAYHAVLRHEPQPDLMSASSQQPDAPSGPMTDKDLARAVDTAVARIAAGEHIDETGLLGPPPERIDPSTGRAALIRKAMVLHRQKQSVLADLDEETRRKLTAVAMQAFFKDKPKS